MSLCISKFHSLISPLISSEVFKYWQAIKLTGVDMSFPKFLFSLESSNFIIGNHSFYCFPWSDSLSTFIFEKISAKYPNQNTTVCPSFTLQSTEAHWGHWGVVRSESTRTEWDPEGLHSDFACHPWRICRLEKSCRWEQHLLCHSATNQRQSEADSHFPQLSSVTDIWRI